MPCSSATYRRLFRRKSPRSGTTSPWKQREKKLPITVSALWHEARHIIFVSPKNNFLSFFFHSFLIRSCHRLNCSDPVLCFLQPALTRSICASSSPLPLPQNREKTHPAFSTPALSGPATLGHVGMSYPKPWRPRSARTDQRSYPGSWGEGAPVPAGRVSTVHYWRSTEGLIWR